MRAGRVRRTVHYTRGVRVRSMLAFSDVHLGWEPCARLHERWLRALPAAAEDAELVLLNGDVLDATRGTCSSATRELAQGLVELAARWRSEGREVRYLEGNHEHGAPADAPLRPTGWRHAFTVSSGERVVALHGHRFTEADPSASAYDHLGKRLLRAENELYARSAWLRERYRRGPAYLVAAVGFTECTLGRWLLPRELARLEAPAEVLLHGHIHYGPGQGRVGAVRTFRTGSFVSEGHRGTADRMLRYRAGRFERIALQGERWVALEDGR